MTEAKKRPRTKHLKRYILTLDNHEFVGRVYDLEIVVYHFNSYEDLAKHDDCKYAYPNQTIVQIRAHSMCYLSVRFWPNSESNHKGTRTIAVNPLIADNRDITH